MAKKDTSSNSQKQDNTTIVGGDASLKNSQKFPRIKGLVNKKYFILLAIFGAVLISMAFWLKSTNRLSISTVTQPNCASDEDLIDTYNININSEVSNIFYETISDKVKAKIAYKNDIVCQYILFNSYVMTNNLDKSSEAYMNLKRLYNEGEIIEADVFKVEVNIQQILDSHKYLDTEDMQQPEVMG